MNILMASDENYVFLLRISLYSLFSTNTKVDEINIYIIADNILDESKLKLQKMADEFGRNLVFLMPPQLDDGIIVKGKLNMSTYYRLKMASVLPDNVDKIIYLDCDTLIRTNLEELWNTGLNDNLIAGVIDTTGVFARESVGLSKSDIYVNAGVLLVDLKRWRIYDIEKKCMTFLEENNFKVEFNDQGVLNSVCKGKIGLLNPKYNFMSTYERYSLNELELIIGNNIYLDDITLKESKSNPAIIHFAGYAFNRPWFRNTNCKYNSEFKAMSVESGSIINYKNQPNGIKYNIRKIIDKTPNKLCIMLNKIVDSIYILLTKSVIS